MTYRKAHGNGADAMARVESAPADELPVGVPGITRPAPPRDTAGRFVKSDGTSALARRGGQARSETRRLAALLGFSELPEGHSFRPYQRLAREWRAAHAEDLAATVGGGQLSPGVASIIASAALALAASRYLHDQAAETGDTKTFLAATRLGDQSRQSLLTAHELAGREAVARQRTRAAVDPFAWLPNDDDDDDA